jgi:hypothetical protein
MIRKQRKKKSEHELGGTLQLEILLLRRVNNFFPSPLLTWSFPMLGAVSQFLNTN